MKLWKVQSVAAGLLGGLAMFLWGILVLAVMVSLTGCGWPPMPDEAWNEIAKRQVSFRAVGMLGIEPHTGTTFCILCYVTYSRNMPNNPDPILQH